jgi:hypothetical protein
MCRTSNGIRTSRDERPRTRAVPSGRFLCSYRLGHPICHDGCIRARMYDRACGIRVWGIGRTVEVQGRYAPSGGLFDPWAVPTIVVRERGSPGSHRLQVRASGKPTAGLPITSVSGLGGTPVLTRGRQRTQNVTRHGDGLVRKSDCAPGSLRSGSEACRFGQLQGCARSALRLRWTVDCRRVGEVVGAIEMLVRARNPRLGGA